MIIGILKFIGSAVYGIIFSYLLWLAYYFVMPYIMSLSKGVAIIIYVFAGTLITGLFISACALLLIPLLIMATHWISKILPLIALLCFGYASIMLPWEFDINYNSMNIAIGIFMDISIAVMYISIITGLFKNFKED